MSTGRATLSFDRRNPLIWLTVGGILLIAAIVAGTVIAVLDFRERALKNSERELENSVLLLTRHFDRELRDFEGVQREVVRRIGLLQISTPDEFIRQTSGMDFHQTLEAAVGASTDTAGINLFDADGRLINSSQSWPVPKISIADRDYFKALAADDRSPSVLLAPVKSRFTGGWTTVIARKVTASNGQFLGVVSRGISPANLETFFQSLAIGKGSAIALLHRDGTLLARYPHIEEMMGRNFRTSPVQQLLTKAENGTIRLISPIDGEDRLASTRALSEFPLSIISTTTIASALSDWRLQTRVLIGIAALLALVIAATLLLIVRKLSQRHAESEHRLALEKERLNTAVNNMTQGLLLYDRDGRVVLCNERYREMYNLSSEEAKAGLHFHDLITLRKETGSFKGNVDEFCASVLHNVALKKPTNSIVDTPDGRSIQIVNRPLENGGWVTTQEDITERRRAEKKIELLAHYDELTGLPNRASFREKLKQELARAKRGEQVAVLYIDIDEFKGVNDTLGHPAGDELLRIVAARLRSCIRETDTVARLGGDEFAIVQTAVQQSSDVLELVKRIQNSIREPHECLGHQVTSDASIGIALAPNDGDDLDQLLGSADLAMYGAKKDGRRTFRFFEPGMDARVKARRTLELDIRKAINDQAFELYYQPVADLQSNEIVGCEALLRWNHPVRGPISPAEFIPVAEETGLIREIGDWVLSTACAEAASWPRGIRLAVNVSPVQFRSETFPLRVANALASSGLPANCLELEITEAVVIDDDEAALALLENLRTMGVRIALDDFGTGYSSLSYLKRFPFDKIKIDRCFVSDIEVPGSAAIVQAVVDIAAARNMTTTAEGVETEEQRKTLQHLGCTEMQGYLFGRPQPAGQIRALLSKASAEAAA